MLTCNLWNKLSKVNFIMGGSLIGSFRLESKAVNAPNLPLPLANSPEKQYINPNTQ